MNEPTATDDLIRFRDNVHSQFGEDGILARVFGELGIERGSFVEFGAWDGTHLSNARHLCDQGWGGVFIEGDRARHRDLEAAFADVSRVETRHAMVSDRGPHALDAILAGTDLPVDFDLLSVDVDGDDYPIWNAMTRFDPKVVIIETNHTFPYNVEFVPRPGSNVGASALAMALLGARKGYRLLCYNDINCIFVRADLADRLAPRNLAFAYLFHVGRHSGLGGFFACDYRGGWHFLPPKPFWGWKKVHDHSKGLAAKSEVLRSWTSPDEIARLFDPDGLVVAVRHGACAPVTSREIG